MFHRTTVSWDATSKDLSLFFDCEERFTHNIDLVNAVFGGDPEVFWGFTSATGGSFNVQTICIDFFTASLQDEEICKGDDIQLEIDGGVTYNWTPSTGLSDPTIPNPIASPEASTLYNVEIVDECGGTTEVSMTLAVFENPVISLGGIINACIGDTVVLDASSVSGTIYAWSTGESDPEIKVTEEGTYNVVLSNGPCTHIESVDVFFEELQTLSLDTLTCEESIFYEGVEILVDESDEFEVLSGLCLTTLMECCITITKTR